MKFILIISLFFISLSAMANVDTLPQRKLIGLNPLTNMPGYIFIDTPRSQYFQHPLYALNDSTTAMDTGSYYISSILKNATRDSVIFTFPNGRRIAVRDSFGTGGGASTVQLDSNLLIASKFNLSTSTLSGTAGLLLRNQSTASAQNSPSAVYQGGYFGTKLFWRTYINATNQGLYFEYSTDSTTWVTACVISKAGLISSASTAGVGGFQVGNGIYNGTKIYFDGRGFGSIGINYPTNTLAFQSAFYDATNYGFGIPQVTTVNRYNYPSRLVTGAIISGGSAYTTGTYSAKAFTNVNGVGVGASGNFTVSGGSITTVAISGGGTGGYKVGDTLSVAAANVGGTGSGFTYLVTGIFGDYYDGTFIYDSTLSKPIWYDRHSHINRTVIDSATLSGNLTTSSAASLTLTTGNDYVFTGTTTTYTLPAVSSTAIGRTNRIYIKNRGSGSITLNSNAGSTLYTTSAQSTITIVAGAACELMPDGTYFNVMFNL